MTDQDTINRMEWENPANWTGPRWLSVYFSKQDRRVWVPKQMPELGWTVNLGQPGGVVWLFVVMLGLPLAILAVCLMVMAWG